ncbi:MAG: hypothetical protein GF330_01720 [Candidatus Eisenbacteria bacterium]|nr:hypothetical protein [Candidatus Eisenbacteria bacterium]
MPTSSGTSELVPAPRRATGPTSRPPRRRLRAECCGALLLAVLAAAPAGAAGIDVGVSRILFRDAQLDRLYGARWAPAVALELGRWGAWEARMAVAYAAGRSQSGPIAYIDAAETEIQFLPLSLQARYRRRLAASWEVALGPILGWAHFRESWRAHVSAADLEGERRGSGDWFGIGGGIEARWRLGRPGALRAGFEWLWSSAQRRVLPGSASQADEMTGGWSRIHLSWELPWHPW